MHNAWFSMYLRKYCRFQLFRFFRIYGSTGLYGDPRTRLQVMPGHRTGFSVRYIGKSRGSLTCYFNASILHRLSLFLLRPVFWLTDVSMMHISIYFTPNTSLNRFKCFEGHVSKAFLSAVDFAGGRPSFIHFNIIASWDNGKFNN